MSFDKTKILVQQVAELQANTKKLENELIDAAFAEFFEAVPEISAIAWKAYIPLWNDGDPCEYRLGDFIPKLNKQLIIDTDQWDTEELGEFTDTEFKQYLDSIDEDEYYDIRVPSPRATEVYQLLDQLRQLVRPYTENVFGANIKVIAVRGDFNCSEYHPNY